MSQVWQAFWFESEKFSGVVDSREKWTTIVKAYCKARKCNKEKTVNFLFKTAKEHFRSIKHVPEFGISEDHIGYFTLGKWADNEGVDLSVE